MLQTCEASPAGSAGCAAALQEAVQLHPMLSPHETERQHAGGGGEEGGPLRRCEKSGLFVFTEARSCVLAQVSSAVSPGEKLAPQKSHEAGQRGPA